MRRKFDILSFPYIPIKDREIHTGIIWVLHLLCAGQFAVISFALA